MSGQAQSNMNSYQQNFQPLQGQEAQQASAYGSNANIQKLQGQAIGNVGAANQAGQQNNAAALASEGVDPASIHGGAIQAQGNVQNAAAAANAGTQAGIQGQQQAFNMSNTANQLGLNVGAAGNAGMAGAASTAQGGQGAANATGAADVSNLAGANSMLNVANTANQNSMTGVQDQFSDQQTSYQDAAAAQAAQMQQIGQVAGMAAMMGGGGPITSMMAGMEDGGPITFRRGIPVFASGGVVENYDYVPPSTPTLNSPSARVVPGPRQILAGGRLTSAPYGQYIAGGQVSARGALPASPIPGSTDTKPALLTPGEFVIPKDVVDHFGNEHFHKLIDSAREKANLRRAIPIHHPPHVSLQ
jgi:hypothetical protein